MSHMVIYRGIDGKPGYQQAEDIHDAVTFVEQMRNEEGVEQARIFRLEEVVFEYRPYYRVELTAGMHEPTIPPTPGPTSPFTLGSSIVDVTDDAAAVMGHEPGGLLGDEPFQVIESVIDDDPDAEAVGGNGARRGLFGR